MRTEHLTRDELEALSRGEERALDVAQHLRACAECREAAREAAFATRYVRPLASGHPDEDLLTALWSGALSSSREAEVRGHVTSCTRCQALLQRLERATPPRAHPDRVSREAMEIVRSWAIASTGARRASLVVLADAGMKRLRAFLEEIAEPLRSGDHAFVVESPALTWAFSDRMVLDEAAMSEPAPEPATLSDGHRTFRFEARPGATGPQLAVALVARGGAPRPVEARLDAVGRESQHAEIVAGGEAVFDLAPGTSRLTLELRPPWTIEIRLDA